ncbi:hypothetical protein [Parendozoicomonas sp. Alg238-R29]|uniref:hypothetical protein n=1 Tax=Parendozoicomonas sp. Alg238-R29 TaxID=2993446 RepID=UPI00248DD062|nr:hypothetical protein [Parendozoicomonas sp. Alg238-R29]
MYSATTIPQTCIPQTCFCPAQQSPDGFQAHLPPEQPKWTRRDISSVNSESYVAKGKQFHEEYLSENTLWAKVEEGIEGAYLVGGGIGTAVGGLLWYFGCWPIGGIVKNGFTSALGAAEALKLGYCPASQASQVLKIGLATVSTSVLGYDLGWLAAPTVEIAFGLTGVFVATGLHIAGKYAHTLLFEGKKECARRLAETHKDMEDCMERRETNGRNLEEIENLAKKALPWLNSSISKEKALTKVGDEHKAHIKNVNNFNRKKRKEKERGISKDMAAHDNQWRQVNGLTSYETSCLSAEYRLGLLKAQGIEREGDDSTIGSRILARKSNSSMPPTRVQTRSSGVAQKAWGCISEYAGKIKKACRKPVEQKQDAYGYGTKTETVNCFYDVHGIHTQLGDELTRHRRRAIYLGEDLKNM